MVRGKRMGFLRQMPLEASRKVNFMRSVVVRGRVCCRLMVVVMVGRGWGRVLVEIGRCWWWRRDLGVLVYVRRVAVLSMVLYIRVNGGLRPYGHWFLGDIAIGRKNEELMDGWIV